MSIQVRSEYTPEKVAELVAEHRGVIAAFGDMSPIGNLSRRTMRAFEEWATTQELLAKQTRYIEELEGVDSVGLLAERDRLHKAITEARKLNDRAQRDPDIWESMERIFRAALDKGRDDDE